MATVLLEFRRLDTSERPVGIAPDVDVRIHPDPTFDLDGMYLDTRLRRYRFVGRTNNNYLSDTQVHMDLVPNDEIAPGSTYEVTVRFGSKKRRHHIVVPTEAQARDLGLEQPYLFRDLISETPAGVL